MASLSEPGQPAPADQQRPSPNLILGLNSNNPFRNPRTASPALPSPAIPSPQSAPFVTTPLSATRPVSTNPFLAAFEQEAEAKLQLSAPIAPLIMEPQNTIQSQPRAVDNEAAQLFHRLTLVDNGAPNGVPQTQARSETLPTPSHRPSRSEEEERRRVPRRAHPRRPGPSEELDIFASPEKQRDRPRPRRNSESSVMEKSSLTEEERKRRERRHRDREGRSRDSRTRDASKSSRDGEAHKSRSSRRKPRGMDLIDQLDQTGIYGAGFFHHDGPFDAVNPHRNRRRDDRAPMRAFPATSANMMIGGSGPLNKGIDLERFHGVGAEGFSDYGKAGLDGIKRPANERATSFDPLARVEPVHGEESFGLGTSTFLEGAPASRKAIQRRESESQETQTAGGLQRKKSLAQRIRGMSRREPGDERPVIRSPETRYGDRINGGGSPTSPQQPSRQIQSAGGPSRAYQSENNPFDNLYDDAYEKKGASIKVAEQEQKIGRERAPSSPMHGLERRTTADSMDGEPKPAGGFLQRVKSLKGGRRLRRES